MEKRCLPCGSRQQGTHYGHIERRIFELLDKRRLVEGDTSGKSLGNDALAFLHELRGDESVAQS
jgi:hypothetical protein